MMDGVDLLFEVAWKYVAGLVPAESLPMEAAHLLAVGFDTPALRDLAGRSRREDSAELRSLLGQSLSELGGSMPDAETADRCLLRHLAGELVTGSMTPGEVAGRVWQGLPIARTSAERNFLQAVGEEYQVDYISVAAPEAFSAWAAELRAAAGRLSRMPVPEDPSEG